MFAPEMWNQLSLQTVVYFVYAAVLRATGSHVFLFVNVKRANMFASWLPGISFVFGMATTAGFPCSAMRSHAPKVCFDRFYCASSRGFVVS